MRGEFALRKLPTDDKIHWNGNYSQFPLLSSECPVPAYLFLFVGINYNSVKNITIIILGNCFVSSSCGSNDHFPPICILRTFIQISFLCFQGLLCCDNIEISHCAACHHSINNRAAAPRVLRTFGKLYPNIHSSTRCWFGFEKVGRCFGLLLRLIGRSWWGCHYGDDGFVSCKCCTIQYDRHHRSSLEIWTNQRAIIQERTNKNVTSALNTSWRWIYFYELGRHQKWRNHCNSNSNKQIGIHYLFLTSQPVVSHSNCISREMTWQVKYQRWRIGAKRSLCQFGKRIQYCRRW